MSKIGKVFKKAAGPIAGAALGPIAGAAVSGLAGAIGGQGRRDARAAADYGQAVQNFRPTSVTGWGQGTTNVGPDGIRLNASPDMMTDYGRFRGLAGTDFNDLRSMDRDELARMLFEGFDATEGRRAEEAFEDNISGMFNAFGSTSGFARGLRDELFNLESMRQDLRNQALAGADSIYRGRLGDFTRNTQNRMAVFEPLMDRARMALGQSANQQRLGMAAAEAAYDQQLQRNAARQNFWNNLGGRVGGAVSDMFDFGPRGGPTGADSFRAPTADDWFDTSGMFSGI